MGNVQSEMAGRTPVGALRPSSREIIANLFDKRGQIHNERLNDYRGFLEIIGCTNLEITTYSGFADDASPTLKLIDDYPDISLANGSSAPTILDGWRILEQLGRQDILDQCCRRVEEDIKVFHSKREPSQKLSHGASQSSNSEDIRHGEQSEPEDDVSSTASSSHLVISNFCPRDLLGKQSSLPTALTAKNRDLRAENNEPQQKQVQLVKQVDARERYSTVTSTRREIFSGKELHRKNVKITKRSNPYKRYAWI